MLFDWLTYSAPAPWPSLILFLWFPKLLLDIVKFGTRDRVVFVTPSSLVEFLRPSSRV